MVGQQGSPVESALPAIRIRGLSRSYRLYDRPIDRLRELLSPSRHRYGRDFWAVKDLDLEVPRGSVVGLIGRNGAGKSTTLKMVAGRLRPTSGSVEVNGRVSVVLEVGTGLNPNLTGRQNARINALFLGLDPWRIEDQLQRVLEFAEIGDFADQPFHSYSSGMKARLAFSVITALEPEILIIDEALATGDAYFSAKCQAFVRQLCRSGCTTLMVSHDLVFMAETCDRVAWIDKGRLIACGAPREVIGRYQQDLGQGADYATRPEAALVRLRTTAPGRLLLPRAHWEDQGRRVWWIELNEGRYLGMALAQAGALGVSGAASREVWGEVEPFDGGVARVVTPSRRADGCAYLGLRLPVPPAPRPSSLVLTALSEVEGDVEVSLFVDGAFRVIGQLRPGGPLRAQSFDVTSAFFSWYAP